MLQIGQEPAGNGLQLGRIGPLEFGLAHELRGQQ